MPLFFIPLILGGTGFAGWGLSKTAEETAELLKWASLAGVIYLGYKHGGTITKMLQGGR